MCNLVSGARHLVAVLKKKDLCRCGCRGWCSIRPIKHSANLTTPSASRRSSSTSAPFWRRGSRYVGDTGATRGPSRELPEIVPATLSAATGRSTVTCLRRPSPPTLATSKNTSQLIGRPRPTQAKKCVSGMSSFTGPRAPWRNQRLLRPSSAVWIHRRQPVGDARKFRHGGFHLVQPAGVPVGVHEEVKPSIQTKRILLFGEMLASIGFPLHDKLTHKMCARDSRRWRRLERPPSAADPPSRSTAGSCPLWRCWRSIAWAFQGKGFEKRGFTIYAWP